VNVDVIDVRNNAALLMYGQQCGWAGTGTPVCVMAFSARCCNLGVEIGPNKGEQMH